MDITEIERSEGRAYNQMRSVSMEREVLKNAQGSCFIKCGDTHVLCAATIEEGVQGWRKSSRAGWVTVSARVAPWRSSASSAAACAP